MFFGCPSSSLLLTGWYLGLGGLEFRRGAGFFIQAVSFSLVVTKVYHASYTFSVMTEILVVCIVLASTEYDLCTPFCISCLIEVKIIFRSQLIFLHTLMHMQKNLRYITTHDGLWIEVFLFFFLEGHYNTVRFRYAPVIKSNFITNAKCT